jgi:branched-chain amino acid transport system substrate-binding protein
VEDKGMRVQRLWWSGLVAAVLGGLVGVTVAGAAGEQFLPILSMREGAVRSTGIPLADGHIAYVTMLNARDGGINGVPLVWEFCETVFDVDRSVECYEHLKAKGPTGAATFQPQGTPVIYAMLERATRDKIPLVSMGFGRTDTPDG